MQPFLILKDSQVRPNIAFAIVFSKKLPHLFLAIEINQIPISSFYKIYSNGIWSK